MLSRPASLAAASLAVLLVARPGTAEDPSRYLHDVLERIPVNEGAAGNRSMDLVWEAGLESTWAHCLVYDPETGEPSIDPACFLDVVIERYRTLVFYRDQARVVRIITPAEGPPRRTETRVDSAIVDGRLEVTTPRRQVTGALADRLRLKTTPALEDAKQRYDLWLAPHMALTIAETDGGAVPVGPPGGVEISRADAALVNERPMVHLALTSGGVAAGEDPDARYDLYVDPESLLVERIEGHTRDADGGGTMSTYEIESVQLTDQPPATDLAPPAVAPDAPPANSPPIG